MAVNTTLAGCANITTVTWSEGGHNVTIWVNDSAGNLNNNLVLTLYKDTLAPIIIVNSPQNNTFWNSRPLLNVTAYDPNLLSISYKIEGYSAFPLLNNTDELFNGLIWSLIPEGMFMLWDFLLLGKPNEFSQFEPRIKVGENFLEGRFHFIFSIRLYCPQIFLP